MSYPNLINDPELLKMKTKFDQLKELDYKTEKQDREKILKSFKSDNEYYRKKYSSLKKRK